MLAEREKLTPMEMQPSDMVNSNTRTQASYQNVVEAFQHAEAARKSKTTDYHINDRLSVFFIAVTVVIVAFSYLLPVVPILVLFSMWLPLPFFKGLKMLWPTRSVLWACALPLFAILSTLWSDYPLKSLYLGVAFLSTLVCIVIINQTVRFKPFVQGIVIGIAVCMVATLQSGAQGTDVFSDTYALVGYFGSKNMVGGLAAFGILASTGLFFLEKGFWRRVFICLCPLVLCIVCLYLSKSATSLVVVVISLATMSWIALMGYLPRTLKLIIVATSMMIAVLLLTGIAMDGGKTLLNALGKDSTLTGRTYLWSEGYKIGWERPVLGHGYSAFWVHGQPQAERYWYEFLITNRVGFHFHNTFVQIFVDLGMVGTLLLISQLLSACFAAARFALSHKMRAEGSLLLGFALMFFIRAFVEVDIIGVFSISALLFYSINLRLAQWSQLEPATQTKVGNE